MGIGEGFHEIVKVASDYTNNGMGQQGSYAAARAARLREANRDRETKTATATLPKPTTTNLETPTNPTAGEIGDATPAPRGGMEVA